jgi:uncharacterized protein
MAKRLQFTLEFDRDLRKFLQEKYPEVMDYRIRSQSLDARGANRGKSPRYQYVLDTIEQGESFDKKQKEHDLKGLGEMKERPLIIGAGPAGLFCALRLADYGVKGILFERGAKAQERMKKIARFWRYGEFDPDNNVCYGEGGAGLFSDGKLITRVKSPFVQYVMDKLVEYGAPAETAYMSNPHLGSNKIRQLINKISDDLVTRGWEVHTNTRVESLCYQGEQVVGLSLEDGREFHSPHVVLATGHSAQEVYSHLKENKVAMKAKDFAVGVRVEHPRKLIDYIQYGKFSEQNVLGAARYRLSWENPDTKAGTYSFCMCPGGYVLSSGTEGDGIVVNGMSNYSRRSPWSNAALVVGVKAGKDFDEGDVLNGLQFQRDIEKRAYELSCQKASGKEIPAQTLKNFLDGNTGTDQRLPKTSCPSGIFSESLDKILPPFITDHLRRALNVFEKQMKGFVSDEALFLAPETRTSAPVTIIRDKETLESISHKGLFPCGEGAGYAGGITSAAVDGVNVAMKILKKAEFKVD